MPDKALYKILCKCSLYNAVLRDILLLWYVVSLQYVNDLIYNFP